MKDSKTGSTWLAAAYPVAIVILLLGLFAYDAYYNWLPWTTTREIDPISQWLFVANRTWSLTASCLLAIVALVLEWRRSRPNGKSSLFATFPGVALLATVATLFVYMAYGK